jgi:hypothetical protein
MLQGETGECVTGGTDINGALVVGYAAPTLYEEDLVVHFVATATVNGYESSPSTCRTTVYSEPDFLSILVDTVDGDIILSGGVIRMEVKVTDWQGHLVTGAVISLGSTPEGLNFRFDEGLLFDDGMGTVLVEAPSGILGDETDLSFYVTVSATKVGYLPGQGLTEVTVVEPEPASTSPDHTNNWRLALIGSLLGAAIILAIYRYAVRSSGDGKGTRRRK